MTIEEITLEKAVELICSGVGTLASERVRTPVARGRILAEDVAAGMDQPPFPRSPVDGYAVISSDTAGASADNPVSLKVVDRIYCGSAAITAIHSGSSALIMTGGMLPEGCDSVIRQEDTDMGWPEVKIYESSECHENYCERGEDYKRGELLAPHGYKLDAAGIAVCASAGIEALPVLKRPRVAIIATGDELSGLGTGIEPGKIYPSSLYYLASRLDELGADVGMTEIVGDVRQEIEKCLKLAVSASDAVITTGGVSVGERDLMYETLDGMNAEVVFHGISMKPGSPTLFAKLAGTPVLSLSGNPFAAVSSFELLMRPLLHAMTGDPDLAPMRVSARLATKFKKASHIRRFIRGIYKDGEVSLPHGHANGVLKSLLGCNCLIDIPEGTGALEIGSEIPAILF
ncbi:MAG: molybdopterin molybdotransferase MoeA [Synergistaceae bacterium]|jgi:molybdopterin molybdotransferase|nr:molybdopterin molybdotransferase MoeA [Synergistaceae bacterium]